MGSIVILGSAGVLMISPSSYVDPRRPTLAHRCRRGPVKSSEPSNCKINRNKPAKINLEVLPI